MQAGFAPLIIIAIVAVLAIGGGVYYAKNNNDGVEAEAELDANVEANMSADMSSETGAKATLRSLLAIGKDVVCEVSTSKDGYVSEGTVFISASGEMRGDFNSSMNGGAATESHMIMQGDEAHVWSGSQGAKVNMAAMGASASSQAGQVVDVDADVEYECSNWNRDASKFTTPSSVNFIDVEAVMKGNIQY